MTTYTTKPLELKVRIHYETEGHLSSLSMDWPSENPMSVTVYPEGDVDERDLFWQAFCQLHRMAISRVAE